MKWIDKIPLLLLVVIAAFMAVAPLQGEAHLLEKSRMLINGALVKPIDIFDFVMHSTPVVLLLVRLSRMMFKSTDDSE